MAKEYKKLKLSDILPSSISDREEVYNSAAAIDREVTSVSQDIREALILYRLDELPEAVLDMLAWQYHVDVYEPVELTVAQKRECVRNAILLHLHKGTRWAVRNQLSTLGYWNVEILEKREVDKILLENGWLRVDGNWSVRESESEKIARPDALVGIPYLTHWAQFAVVTDLTEFERPTALEEIKRAVYAMKPARSQPVWSNLINLDLRQLTRAYQSLTLKITAAASAWRNASGFGFSASVEYSLSIVSGRRIGYDAAKIGERFARRIDGTWAVSGDARIEERCRRIDGTWVIGNRGPQVDGTWQIGKAGPGAEFDMAILRPVV